MPSVYFSEWHAYHIYLLGHVDSSQPCKNYVCTQGYFRVITPHTQCEEGKVISVCVCVIVYNIYIYVPIFF